MARSHPRPTKRAVARAKESDSAGARRYGGRSKQERLEERRARLVEAGLSLFGTRGYDQTTIELICNKANVTARHFYEQFENREALLLAVYEEGITRARRAVLAVLQAHDDPRERVTAGLGAYVHAILEDPRYARVACVEVVGAGPHVERRRREAIHDMAFVIESQANELAARGRVARRDFGLTAIAMAGAVNELVTDSITRSKPPPLSNLVDALSQIFLSVIDASQTEPSARSRPRTSKR